jgi:hypothetical protein
MANYAVIKDGIVTNVIIAESQEIAELVTGRICVEYTDENPATIGWFYNGISFIAPVIEEPTEQTPTE